MLRSFARPLLFLVASSAISGAQEPNVDPRLESACRAAFEALSTGRFEVIAQSFPTIEEMQSIHAAQRRGFSDERKQKDAAALQASGGFEAKRKQALERLATSFERARQDATRKITWAEARFIATLPLSEPIRAVGDGQHAVAPVEFLVFANGELWSFGANNVLRGPRGWAFTEHVVFYGERAREGATDAKRRQLEHELEATRREAERQKGIADEGQVMLEKLAQTALEDARRHFEEKEALVEAKRQLEMQLGAELAEARAAAERYRALAEKLQVQLEDWRGKAEAAMQPKDEPVDAPAPEIEALNELLFDVYLECDALRWRCEQIEQMMSSLPSTSTAAAPAWMSKVAEESAPRAAMRQRLAANVAIGYSALPQSKLLDFSRVAIGVEIARLPSAFYWEENPLVSLEEQGTTLATLLERAVHPHSMRELEGVIFLGSPEELRAFDQPRFAVAEASDGSWSKLRSILEAERYEMTSGAGGDEVWQALRDRRVLSLYRTGRAAYRLDTSVLLTGQARVSFATLFDLAAATCGLRGCGIEGLLIVDAGDEEPLRIPELPAKLLDGLASGPQSIALAQQSLAPALATVAERFGVELKIAANAARSLESVVINPLEVENASLALVLRVLTLEAMTYGDARWRREGNTLVLDLAK